MPPLFIPSSLMMELLLHCESDIELSFGGSDDGSIWVGPAFLVHLSYLSPPSTWQVKEDPAGQGEPVLSAGINNWHVANSEKDAVTITLHGAANLPSTRKGHVPHPYVVV